MSFTCEFCKREYSAKYNLTLHQKTAKFCLKIQKEREQYEHKSQATIEDERKDYKCEFCGFSSYLKNSIIRHQESCKEKIKKVQESCITQKEDLLAKALEYIEKLKQENEVHKKETEELKKENQKLSTELTIEKAFFKNERQMNEQLKVEKENLLKQLFDLKSTPSITNNNTTYNNTSQSSSTKVANICNVNNKLPLTKEFFSKIGADIDFVKEKFCDEKDICRYTLKNGLNNYVLVLDKSRKVLTFTDDKGNTIRDQDGIKLANQLYEQLGSKLENVKGALSKLKDDPNEYMVPTTLDKRKKIVEMILAKNPESLQRFGKAYFSEYSKFDNLALPSPEDEKTLQLKETKKEYVFDVSNFSKIIARIKHAFFKYNFEALNYGLHTIGGFLYQFLDQLELQVTDDNELIAVDDHNYEVHLSPEQFFTLLLNMFQGEELVNILCCNKSQNPEFIKNAFLFNDIFITKSQQDENLIDAIYRGITNNNEY